MPKHRILFKKYRPARSGLKIRRPIERYIMRATTIGFTAFLATLLSASIFAPVQTTSAEAVLLANQATGGSVSLTTTGDINLSMETSASGTIRTAVNSVSVSSGSSGYQLYLSVAGDNNALVRDGGSSSNTADTIPAGGGDTIASPSALETNTWGFAVPATNATSGSGSEDVVSTGFDASYPTGTNSSATSKFAKVPVSGSAVKIAQRTTEASSVITNVYYGANVSTAKASGLYQNTVTYTAIGSGTTDGLASVTPSRTNQLGGGVTLTISTPSTTTLDSVGTVTVTVGGATCTNPQVSKNDNGTGALNNVTCISPALATGWHEVIVNFAGSSETYVVNPGIEYYLDEGGSQVATYMQDFSIADCASMSALSSITLQDNRDNNIYRVTKQADGNCWMTENLRLGNNPNNDGVISSDITLTSANSDIPTGDDSFTIHTSDIQTTTGIDWSTEYDATHIYSFINNNDISTENKRAYGNFYNWYTATASSGTRTGVTGGTDASSSICPKGWKLPTNTGNNSYTNLMQNQISSSIPTSGTNTTYTGQFVTAPLSFVLSGYYDGGLNLQGSSGYYWSRTANSADNAYGFDFHTSGYYNLQSNYGKYGGFSVRCVLVMPTSMQDLTSSMCSNMKTAQTLTLKDSRDQNEYSVTKQADGNCWMTQNLRLGTTSDGTGTQNVTLTATDSDITGSDITIPTSAIQTSGTNWWGGTVDTYHIYARTSTDATTYGNLYNWYTATASSGNASITPGTDAPMSICPSGWLLPQSEFGSPTPTNGSYWNLMQKAISTDITYSDNNNVTYTDAVQAAPLNFAPSGYYGSGINNLNTNGHYWSRTSSSTGAGNARDMGFSVGGSLYFGSGDVRYLGFSVRCVFLP